jgi:hypothetical protein
MYSEQSTNDAITMQKSFINKVYGWMSIGLLITGITAYLVAGNATILRMVSGNPILYFGLFILEIFLVGYLVARIKKMSLQTATNVFIGYSLINGLTLSFIFIAYTKASIASAFFTTAGMFAVMSIYGYTTKKDLTNFGGFLFMGLIGIVIASIVNMFVKNSVFDLMISILGVLIFTGLTAYDTQKIKNMVFENNNSEEDKKTAILGALILYLDFINLFLFLLRLMGNRGRD